MKFDTCVIFGGSGFIGRHLSEFLLEKNLVQKIYWADLTNNIEQSFGAHPQKHIESNKITYLECNVKEKITLNVVEEKIDLIINLAAIHREPGHQAHEYFETNIQGAENICFWAEKKQCENLIFTSSIAPYGPSETKMTEKSIPVPETPYGSSKLVAEKIHIAWQHKNELNRHLVIVRPGVVFGPGEGGNVSRMIKAVKGRYFFFVGNEETVKAGVYVKELCNALIWVLQKQKETEERVSLFNMTMYPAPNLKEYTDTICEVADIKRRIPRVPYVLLYLASIFIDSFASLFGIKQPISPVRVKKLVRSTNIEAAYLRENGYQYQYNLKEAFLDWKINQPQEWE